MSELARKAVAAVLLAILVAIPLLHVLSETLFSAKLEHVRRELGGTKEQVEFVGVAQANGMECTTFDEPSVQVHCDWWDSPAYDLISWIEFVAEGVVATGYFVDGVKSGEYHIRKEIQGP